MLEGYGGLSTDDRDIHAAEAFLTFAAVTVVTANNMLTHPSYEKQVVAQLEEQLINGCS